MPLLLLQPMAVPCTSSPRRIRGRRRRYRSRAATLSPSFPSLTLCRASPPPHTHRTSFFLHRIAAQSSPSTPCPRRPCRSPQTNQPTPGPATPPASFLRPPRPLCIIPASSRALGEPPLRRTRQTHGGAAQMRSSLMRGIPGRWIWIQRQLTVSFKLDE